MAKRGTIPWSSMRKLMKRNGAKRVQKSAVLKLISYLEEEAISITERALAVAKIAKRITIKKDDIDFALKKMA